MLIARNHRVQDPTPQNKDPLRQVPILADLHGNWTNKLYRTTCVAQCFLQDAQRFCDEKNGYPKILAEAVEPCPADEVSAVPNPRSKGLSSLLDSFWRYWGVAWLWLWRYSKRVIARFGPRETASFGSMSTGIPKLERFVILVHCGIEPELDGPFDSDEEQLVAARQFRNSDEDNVAFWLDVCDGRPTVGAYSGKDMEESDDGRTQS